MWAAVKSIIFGVGVMFIIEWVLMIVAGIVRIHWLHTMPALGFSGAVAIVTGTAIAVGIAALVAWLWAWLMGEV